MSNPAEPWNVARWTRHAWRAWVAKRFHDARSTTMTIVDIATYVACAIALTSVVLVLTSKRPSKPPTTARPSAPAHMPVKS